MSESGKEMHARWVGYQGPADPDFTVAAASLLWASMSHDERRAWDKLAAELEEPPLLMLHTIDAIRPPVPAEDHPDSLRREGECMDGRKCVNHCGPGACSHRCLVCLRLAWRPGSGPPCPACPEAKAGRIS